MRLGKEEKKREIACMIENKFEAMEGRIDTVEDKVGEIQESIASGEKMDKGKLNVNITLGSAAYHHTAYVADIRDPCILGLDFLRKYNFSLDFKNNKLLSASEDMTIDHQKGYSAENADVSRERPSSESSRNHARSKRNPRLPAIRYPRCSNVWDSCKIWLEESSFPNDTIEHLRTEEELQALIETVNNASENTNSETENVSSIDNNDPSQNDSPPELNFKTQKKNEVALALIETDILCRQEQHAAGIEKDNEREDKDEGNTQSKKSGSIRKYRDFLAMAVTLTCSIDVIGKFQWGRNEGKFQWGRKTLANFPE
ncbi:hypothetical protein X975_18868, partial [Stegodyphus mimosarum]